MTSIGMCFIFSYLFIIAWLELFKFQLILSSLANAFFVCHFCIKIGLRRASYCLLVGRGVLGRRRFNSFYNRVSSSAMELDWARRWGGKYYRGRVAPMTGAVTREEAMAAAAVRVASNDALALQVTVFLGVGRRAVKGVVPLGGGAWSADTAWHRWQIEATDLLCHPGVKGAINYSRRHRSYKCDSELFPVSAPQLTCESLKNRSKFSGLLDGAAGARAGKGRGQLW
jgi:hypothetical protein